MILGISSYVLFLKYFYFWWFASDDFIGFRVRYESFVVPLANVVKNRYDVS